MMKRIGKPVSWHGVLLAGGYLTWMIQSLMGKSDPQIDYLAILNRPVLEAAEDDKGWAIYRDLWIKHRFCDRDGFDVQMFFLADDSPSPRRRIVRPSDREAWQLATERLVELADLLEGFRVGGIRPSFGLLLVTHQSNFAPADFSAIYPALDYEKFRADHQAIENNKDLGTLIEVPLHHIQVMQTAAQLLIADTRWAIEQGDSERATRNVEAVLGISVQVAESKLMVCSLTGFLINAMALDLIDECLATRANFSKPQLARLYRAVDQIRIDDMIDIEGEQMLFLDVVQKTYTDNEDGDGRMTAAGLDYWTQIGGLAPTSSRRFASRKRLTEKADELFERLDQCLESLGDDDSIKAIEQELAELPTSFTPLKLLFPNAFTIQHATIRAKMSVDSARAALAVIRFQDDHGRWPDSLDQVVGDLLPAVPRDLLDGQPLRYQRRGEGFRIYSVGVNRVDDGGQAVMLGEDGGFLADPRHEGSQEDLWRLPTTDYNLNENYPGDWILWPRNRGREKL
jgi:hypothetical protein